MLVLLSVQSATVSGTSFVGNILLVEFQLQGCTEVLSSARAML